MMIEPITPAEAQEQQESRPIPDEIIEIFNDLIVRCLHGNVATVYMRDVKIRMRAAGIDINLAADNLWFDVESLYMRAGWIVEYNQPGFNESFPSHYTFKKIPIV